MRGGTIIRLDYKQPWLHNLSDVFHSSGSSAKAYSCRLDLGIQVLAMNHTGQSPWHRNAERACPLLDCILKKEGVATSRSCLHISTLVALWLL